MKNKVLFSFLVVLQLTTMISCKREYCDDFTQEQLSFFPYHEGQILKFYNQRHDSIFSIHITRVNSNKSPVPMLAPGVGCENNLEISDSINNFWIVADFSNINGFSFTYYFSGLLIFSNTKYEKVDSIIINNKAYYDLLKSEPILKNNLQNLNRCFLKPQVGLVLIELNDTSYYELQ